MPDGFYRPPDSDVVVVIPQQTHVSLAALAAAGIDTTSPFLVWADRATNSVFALQVPQHRESDPERFFRGALLVTGYPGDVEDAVAEAEERSYESGHSDGYAKARENAEEEREEAYTNGYKAGIADAAKAAAGAGPTP